MGLQQQLEEYFDRLWPICRSITGNGLRESFSILQEVIPLTLHEIPTGTKVFDWEIPDEWNIREAWIETPDGRRVADFSTNNLHVLNYSEPVDQIVSYEELKKHVRTLPNQPNAIPYVTSYYSRKWGFCMTHETWDCLPTSGYYRVYIDSELAPGSLTYGDLVLPGKSKKEILFSTYLCHPSMANNELSGPLTLAFLYKRLAEIPNREYSYRFVFAPETIGVIAYLAKFGGEMKQNTVAGFVATCCGDPGPFVYKQSKHRDSLADRAAEHILKHSNKSHEVIGFAVGGSDERQYCSPGFNLPVGSITRSMYQRYDEYHTSLDNKEFISFDSLEETIDLYAKVAELIERNHLYFNTIQHCEPQLGKRGLYPSSINPDDDRVALHDMLHLLSFADGKTDLIEIADRRGAPAEHFYQHIDKCIDAEILRTKP